jgi:ABC-2 type transport system permease protein
MSQFVALYRTILGSIATKGRLALLGALGLVAILIGFAISSGEATFDPVQDAADMVNGYGLTVLVPVVALVFASAALGDMVDDSTLVYLWLRPVPRETLALAATAAAATISIPLVAVPLMLAAALAGGDGALVAATVAAAAVCGLAYCGLFVALGLRIKRALSWGIAYVLIWEGFVARAGSGAARISIQTYGRSILTEASDVQLDLADVSPVAAVVVPVLVAMVGVALTTRFLHSRDVA